MGLDVLVSLSVINEEGEEVANESESFEVEGFDDRFIRAVTETAHSLAGGIRLPNGRTVSGNILAERFPRDE
jgi:hypothetical protein